jgi:hypothetical protein
MHISATVVFHSPLTIEQLGDLLSEKLLGGIRFAGRDEHLRDEVPAIRSESEILGLRVLIQGFGGDSGYTLEIYPRSPSDPLFGVQGPEDEVDLSPHVAGLLRRLPGITVTCPA